MRTPFFILLAFGFSQQALAASSKHIAVDISYACLSLDGIPIPMDSGLAATCCAGGQLVPSPPMECRLGVNSIGANAGAAVVAHLDVAQKALDVAKSLNGTETNLSLTKPDTNAMTSAGGSGIGGTAGSTGSGGRSVGGMSSGAGAGTGGSGSGGGGDSGGMGFSSSPGAKASNAKVAGNGAPSANGAARYVGVGSGGEKAEGGLFGNLFASLGGNQGNSGASNDELSFEERARQAAAQDNGSITGSPNDASDYLSRIDKTASIFKIVSTRITRETVKKHVGE